MNKDEVLVVLFGYYLGMMMWSFAAAGLPQLRERLGLTIAGSAVLSVFMGMAGG